MRAFARLYAELDASTSTRRKVDALAEHLRQAPAEDAAWAVHFLAGGRPRRLVPARVMREAAREAAGIPEWLFEESYQAVGDLAETIARLLPDGGAPDDAGLDVWMRERLLPLRGLSPQRAGEALRAAWAGLDAPGRFVMNKLITGGFRVGVSRQLVVRALAQGWSLDEKLVAQRMVGYAGGDEGPRAEDFRALVAGEDVAACGARAGHPYPFFLAHPLQQPPEALGQPSSWIVEWKWDGIRAQLVRRAGAAWLWSRGEELVTERFPELAAAAGALPDGTVVDGEVVCWDAEAQRPKPFAALQTRIGRRTLTPKVLRDAPVVLLAYDLLECDGVDLRDAALDVRRGRLERVVEAASQPLSGPGGAACIRLSPVLAAQEWAALAAQRARARSRGVEGLMLKRADSRYGVGRTKSQPAGDWWKWKVDPLSVDAVLVYAQRGHGRRASLYTDYTFAVWDAPPEAAGRRLVPFAKAYSGLSDEEIRQVDAVIRRTTLEKFGPVRSVTPSLVFELGFEGIARSARHKSGIAVRFPRILRWRTDKPVGEADTLATLQALLDAAL
ncbi:MAG TPA: ATP-dependent DNA ligase [Quisquiliibacterium sp.]|nr:ATP-dependent DNA ligase [Quisquiliibacterium sp.]